jgi:hypothetical protein
MRRSPPIPSTKRNHGSRFASKGVLQHNRAQSGHSSSRACFCHRRSSTTAQGRSVGGAGSSAVTNPEIDTPSTSRLSPAGTPSSANQTSWLFNSLRLPTEPTNVRLREMSSRSPNFTLRVTIRPRVPLSSQCRQTAISVVSAFGARRSADRGVQDCGRPLMRESPALMVRCARTTPRPSWICRGIFRKAR